MEEQSSNKKVITTFGLVTMIITAIFGFGNVSNAYLQMGYGSIIWYALAGICFFFPCGLMMAFHLQRSKGWNLLLVGRFRW